jgi:hypothetical protein
VALAGRLEVIGTQDVAAFMASDRARHAGAVVNMTSSALVL